MTNSPSSSSSSSPRKRASSSHASPLVYIPQLVRKLLAEEVHNSYSFLISIKQLLLEVCQPVAVAENVITDITLKLVYTCSATSEERMQNDFLRAVT